jgi:hypothetical protein
VAALSLKSLATSEEFSSITIPFNSTILSSKSSLWIPTLCESVKSETLLTSCQRYLVCLTIAPAFLSASIYVCFCRIILLNNASLSRIKPKYYSGIFITSDLVCLILQAAGGALTSTSSGNSASAESMRQTGINVMIAGLALQVVSLIAFILCASDYIWCCYKQNKASRGSAKALGTQKGLAICVYSH